ncbi:trypsin-like peptidase domain-containing protein [Stieleria sp. TO1_6]|uniref:S1C family serine protease n=1 Tax=Stieleria tagensis TaxID=2956795 RepID=UPI00209B4593|nr:trypsin-like peptidase domain-containing protein [Stieleria tagensis]MCO8120346.1 trypsin-like peptidase domain-containing protein [Stieleria tagensis]
MDQPPPEKPTRETDRDRNGDAAELSSGEGQTIEFEQLDPTRTLIFHRFTTTDSGDACGPTDESEAGTDNDSAAHSESRLVQITPANSHRSVPTARPTQIQTRQRQQARRGDPVLNGLVLLATVMAIFATARFVLPSIVEEIRYAQHRGQLRAEFEVAGEGLRNVSLDTLSQAYQMVTAAAGPSVVHIDVHRIAHQSVIHPLIPGAPSMPISDQGSGVIVDVEGYLLTNRHVIAGGDEITVTLSDGRKTLATVVGSDSLTDLAVLKIEASDLMPIPWGDSERIRVGSPVWAIGSPFGLDRTVTFGILSGKHRVVRASDRYQDFMQSDVAVNPGNSGGPLVDARGTLIGINTAIVGDTYQGVSFSIPSTVAKKIYLQLRESGQIDRGWLGVSLAEVPEERLRDHNHRVRGAMIVALADDHSGAAKAGLLPGDIVKTVDTIQIRDVDHLMQVIGNSMAGTGIQLSILRDDEQLDFNVSLGHHPDLNRNR